jgi:NTE family protein
MFGRFVRVVTAIGALLWAAGCGSTTNQPLNQPALAPPANPVQPAVTFANNPAPMAPQNRPGNETSNVRAHAELALDADLSDDPLFVGLTFSGGGTRAAAFGYGVLKEFEATQVHVLDQRTSMFEHIDVLSGVSGGSVLAGYVGLKGRAGLGDFRERFLLRDAEESINVNMGIDTLGAALAGGINDQTKLPRWLDDNLFNGATMKDLEHTRPSHIHIYASDLYNRQPFVFSRATFDAICSDYDSYPLSHAVAASAAVPFVFSPIVLQTFPDHCRTALPPWIDRAIANRDENEMLRSAARGLKRNRDPNQVKYVKLVDGGLSDNFGVTGFVVDRGKHQTPYSPLSPEHAVKFRRALFLVANAGVAPVGTWSQNVAGPAGIDMVNAISDTAIRANVRANFETFRQVFRDWREDLMRWRCSLPLAQVKKLRGTLTNWNCRDVQFFLGELAFDQLGAERTKTLSAVPTRFKLPQDQVDLMIEAGRDALRESDTFKKFLASLREIGPVAQRRSASPVSAATRAVR